MKLTKTKIKSDDTNGIIINVIILIYNYLETNQEICISYLLFGKTFTYHSCFIVLIHLFFDLLSL